MIEPKNIQKIPDKNKYMPKNHFEFTHLELYLKNRTKTLQKNQKEQVYEEERF